MGLNQFNIRKFPLETINHIKPVLKELRFIASSYSDVIKEDDDNTILNFIRFKENALHSNFYFTIPEGVHELTNDEAFTNAHFTAKFLPGSESNDSPMRVVVHKSHLDDLLKSWISLVLSYRVEESTLSPEDAIQKKYEDEFKEYFVLLDESAEYEPFPIEIQVKLIQLLTHIENRLEGLEEKTEESERILQETRKLKTDIPNLTKAQTVTRLSKIWAWTRKIGFAGMKKVFDMAIEAAVKSVFDGSALRLLHAIHQT